MLSDLPAAAFENTNLCLGWLNIYLLKMPVAQPAKSHNSKMQPYIHLKNQRHSSVCTWDTTCLLTDATQFLHASVKPYYS